MFCIKESTNRNSTWFSKTLSSIKEAAAGNGNVQAGAGKSTSQGSSSGGGGSRTGSLGKEYVIRKKSLVPLELFVCYSNFFKVDLKVFFLFELTAFRNTGK